MCRWQWSPARPARNISFGACGHCYAQRSVSAALQQRLLPAAWARLAVTATDLAFLAADTPSASHSQGVHPDLITVYVDGFSQEVVDVCKLIGLKGVACLKWPLPGPRAVPALYTRSLGIMAVFPLAHQPPSRHAGATRGQGGSNRPALQGCSHGRV